MPTTVCKFGGTSLATADKILQVKQFIEANPARRYVVVSAPGKRSSEDDKVTDLLRTCIRERSVSDGDWVEPFTKVMGRYAEIIGGLGIDLDLSEEYSRIIQVLKTGFIDKDGKEIKTRDYVESRGEYLMGLIMARVLGYDFVDAAQLINFDKYGFNETLTYGLVQMHLIPTSRAVIPGYYGSMLSGLTQIQVFSRGGSDISGAIVARGLNADLYENCTDVPGVLQCDPRVVIGAQTIREMTYREVRELAYMGASVLHPDALLPVWKAGIPTRVLNPFDPDAPSTLISNTVTHRKGSIVGAAGRGGFSVISVTLSSMNPQIGLAASLLKILADQHVSLEHMPGSLDSLSFIVDGKYQPKIFSVIESIQDRYPEAEVEVKHGMTMIAFVGEGMVRVPGSLSKITASLARADVNISMVNQGASEMVILIGVADQDADDAIRAIHRDCIASA